MARSTPVKNATAETPAVATTPEIVKVFNSTTRSFTHDKYVARPRGHTDGIPREIAELWVSQFPGQIEIAGVDAAKADAQAAENEALKARIAELEAKAAKALE